MLRSLWWCGALVGVGAGLLTAQVKSRELEEMFSADTLKKPKPAVKPAVKPVAKPAPRAESTTTVPVKLVAGGPPAGHDPERHAARMVGVKCRVQLIRDGNIAEVDPASVFHSGDRIRLLIEPNVDGYLYILQRGSSGLDSVLFPQAEINNGRNEVLRGRLYAIPSSGTFRFDDRPGEEVIKVILSRTPLASLPAAAEPARAGYQLAMNVVNRELEQAVKSRDLIFEAEEGPAVKAIASTQAVIWMNVNTEKNDLVHFEWKLKHE